MESIKAAEEELETAKKEAEDDCLLLLLLCLDGRNPANQSRLIVYPIITSSLNLQDLQEPFVCNHPPKILQLPGSYLFLSSRS